MGEEEVEVVQHDIIVLGAGITGLRAAIEIVHKSLVLNKKISVGIISKVHPLRSHSVSAEGGLGVVLSIDKGDSFELHAWDTVKGGDFLCDQDAVEFFVQRIPREVLFLEHVGMSWLRNMDGTLFQSQRMGGHSFPRGVFAGDKTGHYIMRSLFDYLLSIADGNVNFYNEYFACAISVKNNEYRGLIALNMKNSELVYFLSKVLIFATGGLGRIYKTTTCAAGVTADGMAIAYRAGLRLKDMEFTQWHPTGLVPSGVLISEAARGEGGYLLNRHGERFMKHYAPNRMETAPRDIVTRAIMWEIEKGNGYESFGVKHVMLDLRHLGKNLIEERLPFISKLVKKKLGLDPTQDLIPVRPSLHYMMGGIHTDMFGNTDVRGVFAAGEVACVSIHGANRLGTNALADCLVYGGVVGEQAIEYLVKHDPGYPEIDREAYRKTVKKIYDEIYGREGGEYSVYELMDNLRETMENNVGIFRNERDIKNALKKIREIKSSLSKVTVDDKDKIYNTWLVDYLQLENMVEIAELIATCALLRQESRGSHYRIDYPNRDDEKWLYHTLVKYSVDGPEISYSPVVITKWKPVERKY
ncbi:MAG: FAD-binding protein [Nitrososphaerota archaeon]